MALHLIVGPPNAGKTGEINRALRGADMGSQPILALPSEPDVRRVQHEAAAKRDFGVRIATFDDWVQDIWGLYGDGRRFVSGSARIALINGILAELPRGELEDIGRTPGLVRLLSRLVQVIVDPIRPTGAMATSIARVIEVYRSVLETEGLIEPSQAYGVVASNPPPLSVLLALNRFTDLSLAQERLLLGLSATSEVHIALTWEKGRAATEALTPLVERLSRQAESVREMPSEARYTDPDLIVLSERLFEPSKGQTVTPTVRLCAATSLNEECALIARQARLARDEVGGTTVIALKDATRRIGALGAALTGEGLDAHLDVVIPFERTPMGKALSALFDAVSSCADGRDHMIAFLLTPYSGLRPDVAAELDLRWRRVRAQREVIVREASANEGPAGRIVRLAERMERSALDYKVEDWKELAGMLLANAVAAGHDGQQLALDAATHRSLVGIVSELDSLSERRRITNSDVRRALGQARVSAGHEERDSEVLVTEVERIRGRRFETVIVGGLTAAEFSSERPRSLTTVMSAALGQAPDGDESLREKTLFHTVVTRARRRLVLVRQVADLKGEPIRQSVFVDEVLDVYRTPAEAAEGILPLGMVEHVLTHDPADPLLRGMRPRRRAQDLGRDTRNSHRRGILEGSETLGALAAVREFSVSEIESYIACPYRWFYDRVVRPAEMDGGFAAREKGSLAHATLARFYTKWIENGARRVRAQDTDEAFRLLDEIERVMIEEAVRGVRGTEEELAVVGAASWARNIVRDDPEYLPGFIPAHHEYRFGSAASRPVTLGGVPLRGSIDRIDVATQGVVVTDYKSSKELAGAAGFATKGIVQAPIYLAVAASQLDSPPLGCVYRSFKTLAVRGAWSQEDIDGCPWSSGDALDRAGLNRIVEDATERVRVAVAGMRDGEIAPRPLHAGVCRSCSARTFCGVGA